MSLPWVVAGGAEWWALRIYFRRDLTPRHEPMAADVGRPPRWALTVFAATVAGC
jgi:hypothetical protein